MVTVLEDSVSILYSKVSHPRAQRAVALALIRNSGIRYQGRTSQLSTW